MRRCLAAFVGAALVFTLAVGAAAAASGSVFTGAWISIDSVDGSAQHLLIGAGDTPTITFLDLDASYCLNRGAPTGALTASGSGAFLTDVELMATMTRASCGSFKAPPAILDINYVYDPGTGTLLDMNGNTWHRPS